MRFLLVVFSLAILLLAHQCEANVHFAHDGTTMYAVPIYYGIEPMMTFGNITGILVNASDSSGIIQRLSASLRSNVILVCETPASPAEDIILGCLQVFSTPIAIITSTPISYDTSDNPWPGGVMYTLQYGKYHPMAAVLRQLAIVQVQLSSMEKLRAMLTTNSTIPISAAVDGSTVNAWVEFNESWWTILFQSTNSILSGIVIALYTILLVQYYREKTLRWNVATVISIINILVSLLLLLYQGISPNFLRRIVTSRDDGLLTSLIFWGVLLVVTIVAAFLYEIVSGKGGLSKSGFIVNSIIRRLLLIWTGIWLAYIIGVFIASTVVPASSYNIDIIMSNFSVIIIMNILIVITAGFFIAVVSFVAKNAITRISRRTISPIREDSTSTPRFIWYWQHIDPAMRSRLSLLVFIAINLLWSAVVVIIATTNTWNNPYTRNSLLFICHLTHSFIRISIYGMLTANTDSNKKKTGSSMRTSSSTNQRINSSSIHTNEKTDSTTAEGDTVVDASNNSDEESNKQDVETQIEVNN